MRGLYFALFIIITSWIMAWVAVTSLIATAFN